ncbi:MAG: ATP synthase F1 subunit gamma [Anaerolineae bacterium]|nr:ATP synthase F1 subunit gamma [Anaerolineae bacterium]
MANPREIRRRIRSVKNIMQITMALEAVSASKVRRATAMVLASRAYANAAMEMLLNIASSNKNTPMHPLLTTREQVGTIAIMLITSDRGQAGAYNANIIRVARSFAQRAGKPVRWIAVGRKGRDALIRMGENVVAEFTGLPAWLSVSDIRPIARVLIDDYLGGNNDETFIAYTDFINQLTQRPRLQRLFPLLPGEMEDLGAAPDYLKVITAPTTKVADYIFEPSAEGILNEIVPKFTETVIYQALLESAASEHSARMVAMRNASDNARELANVYQLSYNKARQAAITSEILDIVGGSEALKSVKDLAGAAPDESPERVDANYQSY